MTQLLHGTKQFKCCYVRQKPLSLSRQSDSVGQNFQAMKTIKIFLGSSLDELYNERRLLGDYIMNSVRPIFKYDDVDVELLKCEDMDLGYTGEPSQNIINDQLNDCNYFIFVFKKKAGDQTRLEYDIARAIQKEGTHQNTTIRVYILSGPEEGKEKELLNFQEQLKKDGLYWSTFNNPEDIRGKIEHHLIQFERQLLGKTKPSIIDEESTTEKDDDALFEEFENNKQKIHQRIDELRQQTKTVMANEDETIAARIFKVIELYKKADQWAAATDYDKEKYSNLLYDYAGFLNKYGLYHDAKAVYLRQISLAEELHGEEDKGTATSYNNIGTVYYNLACYNQALKYYNKALTVYEKSHGTEHLDNAATYSNIAAVYIIRSDLKKALEYYFKTLAMHEKILGTNNPSTATSYSNIGMVYYKQGDYSKAMEYYNKALAIQEKVIGLEHFDTSISYNNIGMVYYELANYDKALEYHSKALAIREKKLGINHPSTGTSYNNIGMDYCKKGNYAKALECYFMALEIFKNKRGEEHPETANTYNNIGFLYYLQGNCDKALEYLFLALKIREKVLGKKHPSSVQSYSNISVVYLKLGDYSNTLKYYFKALDGRESS